MLRKLFGFLPARLTPPAELAARTPQPRADAPHFRRKPVLEALETRLLLSADPLGILDGSGVLALQLGDGNDHALVERIGASAAGGDIVAVTLGAVTQRYGDEFLGIVRLLIDAGAGDDWLRIVGVTVTTDIVGGLGTDTFEWQSGDATWSITAHDTGHVETVTFASFEHLVGADDNRDTFLFAAGAAVSGGVEGGAGGFDGIVIQGGEYENVVHTAAAPGAGAIALDDALIAYSGIEPVTLGATAANLTLNATAADDVATLRYDAVTGQTLLESAIGSAADVAFLNPTASLTINLGFGDDRITIGTLDGGFAAALEVVGGDGRDRVEFAGTVATHGHDLGAAAETIVVGPGSVLRTDLGADGVAGDFVLAAADANAGGTGAADASVTLAGATVIAQNVTISASASFAVSATLADGDSTATVAIFGASEIAAAGTLTIDVRSLVSAAADAGAAPGIAPDPAAGVLESTAAARIGGEAVLAAAGDLAIDVVNAVDLSAAGAPVAVALETTALVEDGATLAGADVSLHAASQASFALTGVVALADFESTTRAGITGAAEISATGAVLISATALDRAATVSSGEAAIEYDHRAVPRGLVAHAGASAAEALRPDADAAQAVDPIAHLAVDGGDDGLSAAHYAAAALRLLPDARETAAEPAHAYPGAWLEDAIARELGAEGEHIALADAASDAVLPAAGAPPASSRAGSPALAPAIETESDARARRAAAEQGGHEDGGEGDTGLGASLVLSVLKDSTLAELARSVATGGSGAVLSATGAPFVRSRARGGAEGAEPEAGGAVEIRADDLAEAVVVAGSLDPTGDAGGADDLAAGRREALRLAGTADLALATAARHDLVGEASGGAERGTAVTPVAPIDVAASADSAAASDGGDTFTLATAPAAARGDGGAAGNVAGLALSTHLAPLEFEVRVGAADRIDDAIRSGDSIDAFAIERVLAVGGLLDPAVLVPAAVAGDAIDAPVAAAAEVPLGDGREVVSAYLAALAAPIAASAGLTRDARRGNRLPGATRSASLAALGRHDAFRSGGNWAEAFVNELGVAPEDQYPNAKIKLKL